MTIDISVTGDKELQRILNRLPDKLQKKIARNAIRKSAKRARDRIVANIRKLNLIKTGRLLAAFEYAPIRSQSSTPRSLIRIGVGFPYREQLGISPDDKYFYPAALEFGHPRAPAYPFMRPAIDEHKQEEFATIGKDIGEGVIRAAKG